MISKSLPSDLIRVREPVFGKDHAQQKSMIPKSLTARCTASDIPRLSALAFQGCLTGLNRSSKLFAVVPAGMKRERGACALNALKAAAAPSTVSGEPLADIRHWESRIPGKAAGDSDPRARRSATSNGHARARRAGCPGEFSPVVGRS